MKRYIIIALLMLLTSLTTAFEQVNKVEEPLRVMYPFSINLKFDTKYSYLKAEIEEGSNFIKFNDENWSKTTSDSLVVSLMAIKSGVYTVPALSLELYHEFGVDSLTTLPFEVDVIALTDSTSVLNDIKPISRAKEPLLIQVSNQWLWTLLKYLFVGSMIALIAYVIYKYRYALSSLLVKAGIKEEIRVITPWEFAFAELKSMKKRMLLVKGNEELFYAEISLLIRRFLEKYHKFPAAERTTSELMKEFNSYDIAEKSFILEVLQQADIVKFTKGKSSKGEIPEDIHNWFSKYVKSIETKEEAKLAEERSK